jgi:GNAT superfamily N-acetyltransferase
MVSSDLSMAEAIADVVHPDLPEDPAVFAERLALFPGGCFMLGDSGYVIAHPWIAGQLPKLNVLIGGLPDRPDTFFIHDLALREDVRGQGHAAVAVRLLTAEAARLGLATMSLISVGSAEGFWRRQGFAPAGTGDPRGALALYGPGARAMVRRV